MHFHKQFLGVMALCFLLSFPAFAADREATYDRVMRTGTIRCGYTSWDPLFYIDQKTGEKKGIFHDVMEEAAKRLGVKVVWQEELGWGTVVEAVRTGRVDMACAGYWLNPARIRSVSSSAPQLYSPLYIWVRQDETRVFKTMNDLNSSQLTVTAMDGSAENPVVAARFPKTKLQALPELNTSADELQALLTRKADFIVLDKATAGSYIAANPGKIRNLFPDQPLVIFPNVMLLPPRDPQLKEAIDAILLNIEYDGTLDTILKAYKTENIFLRNPKPGQAGQ